MKPVLEMINGKNYAALRKSVLQHLPDYREQSSDARWEISHALGGGYVFQT